MIRRASIRSRGLHCARSLTGTRSTAKRSSRRLLLERLESRRVLADIATSPLSDATEQGSNAEIALAGSLIQGTQTGWSTNSFSSFSALFSGDTQVTLDHANNLVLTDSSGSYADDIRIRSDTSNQRFVITGAQQVFSTTIPGATGDGTTTLSIPFAAVTGNELRVNTSGGLDTLTLDYSLGPFAKQVSFVAGESTADRDNRLILVAGSVANATYHFTGSGAGAIVLTGNAAINYTHVEPIRNELATAVSTLHYSDRPGLLTLTPRAIHPSGVQVSSANKSIMLVTPSDQLAIIGSDSPDNDVLIKGTIDMLHADLVVTGRDIRLEAAALLSASDAAIQLDASRSVTIADQSIVSTEQGAITVLANHSSTPLMGSFSGIEINDSRLSTVSGRMLIEGRGGSVPGGLFHAGVRVVQNARIESTGVGPNVADITIQGHGGAGDSFNPGIFLADALTTLQTVDADLVLQGFGGTSSGNSNYGIALLGGRVLSTGVGPTAGNITLTGVGGVAASDNVGVFLTSNDTKISAVDGDISITGMGRGSNDSNQGLVITSEAEISSFGIGDQAGKIRLSGTGADSRQGNTGIAFQGLAPRVTSVDGDVFISGTGGASTGGANNGVSLFSGTVRSHGLASLTIEGTARGLSGEGILLQGQAVLETLADGDIHLTGRRAGFNEAILIGFTGATIGSPLSKGDVLIQADALGFDHAVRVQGSGSLTIMPTTLGTSIGLGGAPGTLNLNDQELAKLADGFGVLTIGDNVISGPVAIATANFTDAVRIIGRSVDLAGLNAPGNPIQVSATTGSISDSTPFTDITGDGVTLSGLLSPGGTPGTLAVSGGLTIQDDSFVSLEIGGSAPLSAPNHDFLDVLGEVSLGSNVRLTTLPFGNFTPDIGNRFVIINNDGTDPIEGQFAGLAEGGRIDNFLGSPFSASITYQGGTNGNDVVLTVLPNVTLSVSPLSISEQASAEITATLPAPLAIPVLIDLSFSGAAVFGVDYTVSGSQIVIPAGLRSGSIRLTASNDSLIESAEEVVVQILRVENTFTIGTEARTVTIADDDFVNPLITSPVDVISNATTIPIEINFSGDVSGFGVEDLLVSGATIDQFTNQGAGRFSANLIPAGEVSVQAFVQSGAGLDVGQKPTLPSNLFSRIIDRTPPLPVLRTEALLTARDTVAVTIEFGEPVTGFTLNDLLVVNGIATSLSDEGSGRFHAIIDVLADGNLTVDVPVGAATDAANQSSLAASQLSVQVDSTGPVPVIQGPSLSTNSDPFVLEILFGEVVSGFAVADLAVVNGTLNGLIDRGAGRFEVTVDPLFDGEVTVSLGAGAATDAVGNSSQAATPFRVNFDATSPRPTLTAPLLSLSQTFAVQVQFDEPVLGFGPEDLRFTNARVVQVTDQGSGSYAVQLESIDDGVVQVQIAASSAFDNTGSPNISSNEIRLTVDTTAPALTVPADLIMEGDTTGGATASNELIINFLAAANATDLVDLHVSITHNAPPLFAVGTTIVTFTAIDDAGYTTVRSASVTVVDTLPPVLSAPATLTIEANQRGGIARTDDAISTFLLAATATDVVDNAVTVQIEAPDFFSLGTTVIRFRTSDDSGNQAVTTANITVTDSTAPIITVPANLVIQGDVLGGATSLGAEVSAFLASVFAVDIADSDVSVTHDAPDLLPLGTTIVRFTAADDEGNVSTNTARISVVDTLRPMLMNLRDATFEANRVGGLASNDPVMLAYFSSISAVDTVDGSVPVQQDAPLVLPLGVTIVNFTATDLSNNSVMESVRIQVTDTTPPTIAGVRNVTVEGNAAGGATNRHPQIAAALSAITAGDLVDASPSITNDAPELFSIGDTVVTITARDDSGNLRSATLTVSVIDTTPPELTPPPAMVVAANVAGGADAMTPLLEAFLSSFLVADIVDANVIVTDDAPAVFPVGTTTVTFTAIDASGNQRSAVSTVTVIDLDFGDAPAADGNNFVASYPTTFADDGARHAVGALRLGRLISVDVDGQPSTAAAADDDDGVTFLATILRSSTAATVSSVRVTASSAAKLDGWIDLNRDGDWQDEGEQLFASLSVSAGANLLPFAIPAGTVTGMTALRFRLSTSGRLSSTGLATDGEVEDYVQTVRLGSSTAEIEVELLGGESSIAVMGSNLVVRSAANVLFEAPFTAFGGLHVSGTALDDLLALSILDAIGNRALTIDGGDGEDVLLLQGTSTRLDLTDANLVLRGLEALNITGAGNRSLVINPNATRALNAGRPVRLIAEQGDRIEFEDAWRVDAPRFVDGRLSHVIASQDGQPQVQLFVQNDRLLQNPFNRFDADRDGNVFPLDAIRLINELRRRGSGPIELPTTDDQISRLYFDVSGDNTFTPLDALQIINELARVRRSAESESIGADWDDPRWHAETSTETNSVDMVFTFASDDVGITGPITAGSMINGGHPRVLALPSIDDFMQSLGTVASEETALLADEHDLLMRSRLRAGLAAD